MGHACVMRWAMRRTGRYSEAVREGCVAAHHVLNHRKKMSAKSKSDAALPGTHCRSRDVARGKHLLWAVVIEVVVVARWRGRRGLVVPVTAICVRSHRSDRSTVQCGRCAAVVLGDVSGIPALRSGDASLDMCELSEAGVTHARKYGGEGW